MLEEERPGRPRKLTDEQLDELESVLQNPPTEAGFDAPAWTAQLLQEFIRDQFTIDYSRPSCRRFMKKAGLSYQMPRKAAADADPEDCEAFERGVIKTRSRLDATLICIDHTRTSIRGETTQAWFPRGVKPSIELSGQRDWTGVLGAVSEDGEEFYCQSDEYITGEHTRTLILTQSKEFDDALIVVLDGVPYFGSSNSYGFYERKLELYSQATQAVGGSSESGFLKLRAGAESLINELYHQDGKQTRLTGTITEKNASVAKAIGTNLKRASRFLESEAQWEQSAG